MTNVSPTGRPAACHYCGLPIAGGAAQARSPSAEEAAIEGKTTRKGFPRQLTDEPRFCCSGCRFASAITAAGGADAQARWMMTRLGIAIFFSMNVMVFTFLLWSQVEGEAAGGGAAAAALYGLARHACLLFSAPVLLLLGGPLAESGLGELRRGRLSLDLLLV